jgi:hypothetical protein
MKKYGEISPFLTFHGNAQLCITRSKARVERAKEVTSKAVRDIPCTILLATCFFYRVVFISKSPLENKNELMLSLFEITIIEKSYLALNNF